MRRRLLVAALVLAAAAPAAFAEERSPAERQTLVALAYVLGESHAIRQLCNGVGDQYWRTRMRDLIAAEQPDAPFSRRLSDSFNDGFVAGQQAYTACDERAKREAARAAAKGRELAVTLSGSVADDAPTR
ncbi:MAG TPA: TIGR02301 family protein [Caulobacteraceae bacterium]|nr:TIGR02301 family protein [Caulobacteraceae bacterium]